MQQTILGLRFLVFIWNLNSKKSVANNFNMNLPFDLDSTCLSKINNRRNFIQGVSLNQKL